MELKGFQKSVLKDLRRFLELLSERENIKEAYCELWEGKGVPVRADGMPPYHTTIPRVPQVCIKMPTGGGKTFLAANAIRPIFDVMPHIHPKAVVWLVPSDAILRQTHRALSDRTHPYRQKLDVDFGGRVEVYTKEELLSGKNFQPVSVDENLSVFVLTYDSFRTNKKDGRKAYQENGNLMAFTSFYENRENLLPDTSDTALVQVIRNLNPIVIVDESHHATSKLSIEMLENFNPCFVLELTATPKTGSNIISIVDAKKLKKADMVKLPVIVYNQKTGDDVLFSAIALQERLERTAKEAEEKGGDYIRPIVLFQAQPRINEDATTYQNIKKSLLRIGVPEEYIAIKTGEKDEIKDIDLLARDCPIRFIITVNALKEGWDCPFAYILATVANRSSIVDVEQILGRILRMPYAKAGKEEHLNLSYVITSSVDFYATLDKVVAGLMNAGFSKRDHRVAEDCTTDEEAEETGEAAQFTREDVAGEKDTLPEIDIEHIKERLLHLRDGGEDASLGSQKDDADTVIIEDMFREASEENRIYWENVNRVEDADASDVPYEVEDYMNKFYIRQEYRKEVEGIVIPQFMRDDGITYFGESGHEILDRAELGDKFTLKDKDTIIDFGDVRAELAKVDVDASDEVPKAFKMRGFENETMRQWFDAKPSEEKQRICKDIVVKQVSRNNAVSDKEIAEYVDRIVSNLSQEMLADFEQAPELYAEKIRKKVEELYEKHKEKTFHKWMEQDRIVCEPHYHFKESISPSESISSIPKSLYEEEDGNLNDYERDVIWELSALDNIRWWHRNMPRTGFAINGAVMAYPDFIVRTESGKTLMVETKGDHLDNSDSEAKARAGEEWAKSAGRLYKYYMVFPSKRPGYPGAYSYEEFMDIVKEL